MSRPPTARDAVIPIAALVAALTLLAVTHHLLADGKRAEAVVVAVPGLLLALLAAGLSLRLLLRAVEEWARLRRQRAELERQRDVRDGGETP
jgi:hypothetical protein